MALLSEVGTFGSAASTGNQSVTGVGFTPKVVLFWNQVNATDGVQTHGIFGVGCAISSSSRAVICITQQDALSTSNTNRRHDNTKCLLSMGAGGTVYETADFVSHDADGFTVNWTTISGSYIKYNYLALGGDDLTNVYLDEITSPASTGSQSYTGVGFQPTALIGFTASNSVAPADTEADALMGIGVSDGTTSHAVHVWSDDAVATSNTTRYQADKFLSLVDSAVLDECSVTSLDADGYTLNWTTADATARYAWVLCLKGPQVKVAAYDQTATDTTANRSIGFTPAAALIGTHMGPGTGVSAAGMKFDGANDEVSVGTITTITSAWSVSFFATTPTQLASTYGVPVAWGNSFSSISIHNGGSVLVYKNSGGTAFQWNSAVSIDSAEHHFVYVESADGNTGTLYIDGVDQGTADVNNGAADDPTSVLFGDFPAAAVRNYRGSLREVYLYDDALTSGEVTYRQTEGASGDDPGSSNLQGHWAFTTDLTDSTANNYDGTLSGAINDDARIGIGAWDSSNNMAFAGAVDEDAQATTDADRIQDSNEAIKHINHAQTVVGSCSLSASGSTLTETWTNTDGTQREHFMLVLGAAAVGGFPMVSSHRRVFRNLLTR